jgi:hypothetical protein
MAKWCVVIETKWYLLWGWCFRHILIITFWLKLYKKLSHVKNLENEARINKLIFIFISSFICGRLQFCHFDFFRFFICDQNFCINRRRNISWQTWLSQTLWRLFINTFSFFFVFTLFLCRNDNLSISWEPISNFIKIDHSSNFTL